MDRTETKEMLDSFEQTLEDGLVKLCLSQGLFTETMICDDISGKWEEYIKAYIMDACRNFNEFPDSALCFSAYLGMGVAFDWDSDWEANKSKAYDAYYGNRGFDNMDDNITDSLIHIPEEENGHISNVLFMCTEATLSLIQHEQIDTSTEFGFFILARCYTVFYRLGVYIELSRLGYRKIRLDGTKFS